MRCRSSSAKDGRVHTSFNQAVAATGRLSSSDPNLQNIPIRTELGREIRKAFVADEGNVLLAADYSQVELRILAHISQDAELIETFQRGADIHRATASKMFNIPEDELTHDQRRAAKTINFGVLYGMSAFRLSNELNIPTGQAKDFIDAYFARYPKIQEYLDRTLEEARRSGKVTTLFGRVRYIPEIHNKSFTVRGNAERMATNAPIQGTAADILKLAMIALDKRLRRRRRAMLLTVHDEIVIEAPEASAAEVAGIVKETMENIFPLAVPLAGRRALGQELVRREGVKSEAVRVAARARARCSPATNLPRSAAAPKKNEPTIRATVVTIQTTIQPANKTYTHTLVIANDRARSTDEVDRWRLFDFAAEAGDVRRRHRAHDARRIVRRRDRIAPRRHRASRPGRTCRARNSPSPTRRKLSRASPPNNPSSASAPTNASCGSDRTRSSRAASSRCCKPASPRPRRSPAITRAADEALMEVQGFPLADHAELPYENKKMVVDHTVMKIEQRDVPATLLTVNGKYAAEKPRCCIFDERAPMS